MPSFPTGFSDPNHLLSTQGNLKKTSWYNPSPSFLPVLTSSLAWESGVWTSGKDTCPTATGHSIMHDAPKALSSTQHREWQEVGDQQTEWTWERDIILNWLKSSHCSECAQTKCSFLAAARLMAERSLSKAPLKALFINWSAVDSQCC